MDSFTIDSLNTALAGKYVVEREIGAGGMAIVFLAQDARHQRRVALKVLRSELAAVIGAERFLAEIQTTAALQHPAILPLFDSGEAAGQLYYVMPYVEGESLRARLDRERQLPIADAVRIAREVGDALAYAHDRGVIHRDIKPENILLQSGHPMLADFGIALAVQQAGGNRLTATGLSLGTPQYMSPEQAGGERVVDGRTDQYALGAVLYEMLVGAPPFVATSTQALIAKLMTEDPAPVVDQRKNVPEAIAAAVHQSLEKLPADRFATTQDFLRALEAESATRSVVGSASSRKLRNRRSIPTAAALLIAGAAIGTGIGATVFSKHDTVAAAATPIRFTIDTDSGQRFTTNCCGNMFAISRDGKRVAYQVIDPDEVTRLHVREMDGLDSRKLMDTERSVALSFSPDGGELAYATGRTLRVVNVASGQVRTVANLPTRGFIGGTAWTTDGRILFSVSHRMQVVPAGGGPITTLLTLDSAQREQLGGPHFVVTRSGGAILYAVLVEGAEPDIRITWLPSLKSKRVATGVAPVYVPSSGDLVAVRSDGSVEAHPFDPEKGDTLGPARRIADGVTLRSPVLLHAEFTAADNGTMVLAAHSRDPARSNGELAFRRDGKDETHPLPFHVTRIISAAYSRDGRRILGVALDAEAHARRAFVYDPVHRTAQVLSDWPTAVGVDWVGNDSVMAVLSNGDVQISAVDGGSAHRIGHLPLTGTTGISVNGPWLVFDGAKGETMDIGIVHRDSMDHPRTLIGTPAVERYPWLSRDGKLIAYSVTEAGRTFLQVTTFPVPGEHITVSPQSGFAPVWAEDGRLYYLKGSLQVVAVTLQRTPKLALGSQKTVTTSAAPLLAWDVRPDGKEFVFASAGGTLETPRLVVTLNAFSRNR
jgi:serine/threonine protein kinase